MNNKKVLEHCPNFYNINNFTFFDDDYISGRLIEIYRKFIFETDVNNEEDLKTLEKIDYVLNKYIEDYMFRKQLQKDVLNIRVKSGENLVRKTIEAINRFYDILKEGNINVTIRREFGSKVSAACGQLRSEQIGKES